MAAPWRNLLAVAGTAWNLLAGPQGLELGEPPRVPEGYIAPQPRSGVELATPVGTSVSVEVSNREDVRRFYNLVYAASTGVASDWTGSFTGCHAGTTSAALKEAVLLRINFFRAMAGVPATVVLDDTYSAKDQQAAYLMSVNTALDHYPPGDWNCYTDEAAEAAGKSNLALGDYGPAAISGYMDDYGSINVAVGHRRWMLYPQTRVMGTGDLPFVGTNLAANATWILDSHFNDPRPATRDTFVAWPPPGYVPYPLVHARWSFSYPKADFAGASVQMSSNGVPVAITVEPLVAGYGESSIVWHPNQLDTTGPVTWTRPTADTPYVITVNNVLINGAPQTFQYTVTIFDPQVPGPDAVWPTVTGPEPAASAQPNLFTLTSVPGMTGSQWIGGKRAALTAVEGAEGTVTAWTTNVSPGYKAIITSPRYSGANAFHLAHTQPTDQTLTCQRVIVPLGETSTITFRSRLSWATSGQLALVQVSPDQGQNWWDIYSQAGANGEGEVSYAARTASLAAFAGRVVLVRFNYHYSAGSWYSNGDDLVGWHLDEIGFTNVEELTSPTTGAGASDQTFSFTPAQTGDYALAGRAGYYEKYFGEWGPVKHVTVQNFPVPVLTLSGPPTFQGNQIRIEVQATNLRAGQKIQVLRAAKPEGPWTIDTSAVQGAISVDSNYSFTVPFTGTAPGFIRVRAI